MSAADHAWIDDAACAGMDPELFFPSDGVGVAAAIRFCNDNCPVIRECRDTALRERREAGVWGASSAKAREPLMARTRDCPGGCGEQVEVAANRPARCKPCAAEQRKAQRRAQDAERRMARSLAS